MITLFEFTLFAQPETIVEVAERLQACGIQVESVGTERVYGVIGLNVDSMAAVGSWATDSHRTAAIHAAIERLCMGAAGATVTVVKFREIATTRMRAVR